MARPLSISNLKQLSDGSWRFSVVVHTSMGLWYNRGFTLTPKGRVMEPRVRIGAVYYALDKITPFIRSNIKRLVLEAIQRRKGNDQSSSVGDEAVPHNEQGNATNQSPQ
jgi:hypothetical protein